MAEDHLAQLVEFFGRARRCVVDHGFGDEIEWAAATRLDDLTEPSLLRELAWCILNSGMREAVVRRHFLNIASSFWHFRSSAVIAATGDSCARLASRHFNHRPKLLAIVEGARRIEKLGGFARVKKALLEEDPIALLQGFDFIGPTTVWHLARNIGVDCSKPDRHLVRLAAYLTLPDVATLCEAIASRVHERVGVIDIVLWRHETLSCDCPLRPADAGRSAVSFR